MRPDHLHGQGNLLFRAGLQGDRLKIRAWIGGGLYRGSLVRMGGPCHMLLVRKDIREQIGKTFGDEVEVVVEEDTEPRVVEVPSDLRQALERSPEAAAFFERLSYTHRKEYVQWIEEARRDRTRAERIGKAVEMLGQGTKAR